jgi:hypothetical protein
MSAATRIAQCVGASGSNRATSPSSVTGYISITCATSLPIILYCGGSYVPFGLLNRPN